MATGSGQDITPTGAASQDHSQPMDTGKAECCCRTGGCHGGKGSPHHARHLPLIPAPHRGLALACRTRHWPSNETGRGCQAIGCATLEVLHRKFYMNLAPDSVESDFSLLAARPAPGRPKQPLAVVGAQALGHGRGKGILAGKSPSAAPVPGAQGPWSHDMPMLLHGIALAAWMIVLGGSGPAGAQERVLVSNIGQEDGGVGLGVSPIFILQRWNDHAQKFRTGNNSLGYRLSSVEIQFATFDTGFSYTVTIQQNNGGNPGGTVGTMSNPTASRFTSDRVLKFSAPPRWHAASAKYRLFRGSSRLVQKRETPTPSGLVAHHSLRP